MNRQIADHDESPAAEALALARRYSGQLSLAQKRALHFEARERRACEALRTVRRMAWMGDEHADIAAWIGMWLEQTES